MSEPVTFAPATARMALPLLAASQAQKELFHNEALARIDSLMHAAVLGEENDPPVDPMDGDGWLVAPLATGAWSGHEGNLAMRQGGQWLFVEPIRGMRIYDVSAQQFAVFSGGWQKAGPVEEPSGGLTVDSQARAAIEALITALRAAGIFPSA